MEAVRAGTHEGFDRAVFQWSEPPLPGYHIEYVDHPVRACGSGHVVELPGDGWLSLTFEPARSHDEQGHATVQGTVDPSPSRNMKKMVRTCDFEGQVTWVLAVGSPTPYRILELADPPRVVVDVRHR